MKRFTLLFLVVIFLLGGALWFELKESDKKPDPAPLVSSEPIETPQRSEEPIPENEEAPLASVSDEGEYPKITTEEVNGRTERTIHMGVRQWVWEPSTLYAQEGELVRLVIHNADVNHPLYIPELGIEAEVPPEGAVVEFEASKKGSFFFLCGTYCGEGHAEMQGTLIIE